MRPPAIAAETIAAARQGQPAAMDALLAQLQPLLFNLAVRMLGNREDARDACQEILLKVATGLGRWRGEASLTTWAFQVARNHLATARTRSREYPGLPAFEKRLRAGLALAGPEAPALTPEDKAEARELAVRCTQGMLMCLDRDQRLAWLLDAIFGLTSQEAAAVLGITPAAHRKRLSRARQDLHAFSGRMCGLVAPAAPCRCERQLPAARAHPAGPGALVLEPAERALAEAHLDRALHISDLAGLVRAHPSYRAPEGMVAAVRAVLRQAGAL